MDYFTREYIRKDVKDKAICIVDAGGATGGTATCDYQYNEIHYDIHFHFPEHMDAKQLKQVLEVLKNPEKLPEEIDNEIIKKKSRFFSR